MLVALAVAAILAPAHAGARTCVGMHGTTPVSGPVFAEVCVGSSNPEPMDFPFWVEHCKSVPPAQTSVCLEVSTELLDL
ncbi:MAG TPA: hypothetical protein VGB83_05785 [Actinomycetota bacterium]